MIPKMITCFFLWFLSCALLVAESGIEFSGTLTVVYFGPGKTNKFAFDLQEKAPNWHLSMILMDNTNLTFEMTGSEKQTVWTIHSHENPQPGKTEYGQVKVFAGSRPYNLRGEEHIWLALLSRPVFSDQRVPFKDLGLCMAEPSIVTKCITDNRGLSPSEMEWRNDRAKGEAFIEGRFKWLGSTNFQEFTAPLLSTLAIDTVTANGNHTNLTLSELSVDKIMPLESPIEPNPVVESNNVTMDYRPFNGHDGGHVKYLLKESNIPSISAPIVQHSLNKQLGISDANAKPAPLVFWVAAIIVGSAPLILLLIRGRTGRKP